MDQPNDDRAVTTTVQHWTSHLPGLTARHGCGAVGTATSWAWKPDVAMKAGSPWFSLLCVFMGPEIRSLVLVPASMVGGEPGFIQE